MATHSSIIARINPWIGGPGALQSLGHKELDTTEQPRAHACSLGEVTEPLFASLVFICKTGVILVAISSMEK